MRLGRSFFSLYTLIILSFIVFSWLLDELWRSYLEQDIESYTGYKTMLQAIGDYMQKHPQEEWPEITATVAKKYQLPFKLMPYSQLKDVERADRKALNKGNTYVYYGDDDVVLHHLIENSQTLLVLGPAKMPTRPRAEALLRAFILALLGLVILFWLSPISKDLDALRKSAEQLGEGDFNTNVPAAKSNMMASMVSAFNMMARKIQRLINAHKELSSAVAHELRTPLARTKFALQMLESNCDAEKQKRYRNQITQDVAELEELINEMLLYASFDSEKPELVIQEHELLNIIAEQVENVRPFVSDINIQSTSETLVVACDSHFISRAIANYVTNAKKYGDGKITVYAGINDGMCTVSVDDNGRGVPDSFKPTIFDAFSRGDESRNKETGGFGLGLAIVSRIMEWHNGSAWVEDSPMGGASFKISWPVSQSYSA
ncbi:ATP-binding protein [Thalassotalea fusca]